MGKKILFELPLVFCKFITPSSKVRISSGSPVRLYSYGFSFDSQGSYEGYKTLD